jgi:EAL domain-containing protein (putative c-di-GMP-specific phosphodiesterase class I)
VTHITLSKKTTAKPCLEFYSDNGAEARRVTIEQFPFIIGRAESTHLRIESAEVSREHAEILERHGMCLLRDKGSTNGTQVNGKTIKETLLADGDIIRVAEVELTFIASAVSQFQRMVTQPIHSKKSVPTASALPPTVAAARMIAEGTLAQAMTTRLLAIRSLRSGGTEAYCAPLTQNPCHRPMCEQSNVLLDRYREIERLQAVSAAVERDEAPRLFIAVSPLEIESPQHLLASLTHFEESLPAGWELGVTFSLPDDVDILRITEVYRQVRDRELLVAFDEFQGNGGQVMHLKSLLPDYLILAPSMTRDLATARQSLRRLESLVVACEELNIKPVLPRDDTGHASAFCQEIGFDLVLQAAGSRAPAPKPQLILTA